VPPPATWWKVRLVLHTLQYLGAVGRSVWMREEVFSPRAIFSVLGLSFITRSYCKCGKRNFWHTGNWNHSIWLHILNSIWSVFVLEIYCETKWRSKWLFATRHIILYRQQTWETTRRKQREAQGLEKHIWKQLQKSWLKVTVYDKLLPSIQLTLLHCTDFVRSLEKEVLVSNTFAKSL